MVRQKRCFACRKTSKQVLLHKFPEKSSQTFSKWKQFCSSFLMNIREEDNFEVCFLCTEHFVEGDYTSPKRLKTNAIPSVTSKDKQILFSYPKENEMATHSTFGRKGLILHGQARQIIYNVIKFMKREAYLTADSQDLEIGIPHYKQRVLAATGISEKIYKSVVHEGKRIDAGVSTSFVSLQTDKNAPIMHIQAREIIFNVFKFMKSEAQHTANSKDLKLPILYYKQRVLAATGASERIYRSVVHEGKEIDAGACDFFASPRKKGGPLALAEVEKEALQNITYDFHITEERTPFMDDQNDVIEVEDDKEENQPVGVEFLKVCRSCLKIINIADAVSLDPQKNSESIELMNKLKDVLQMDLMSVDDPHLCKDCVRVVETTYQFKVTCEKNECALTKFDWEAGTKNLLFFVDQQELKYKCNEVRMKQMNEGNPHLYINDSKEIDWDKFWQKLDKEGNGLSDMEDHWYGEEPHEKVHSGHDCHSINPPTPYISQKLPQSDDLFSTDFDLYFDAHRFEPASEVLKKKCRKYRFKDIGPGPYVCEICGKVTKQGIQWHLKEHMSLNRFECRECGDVLSKYSHYVRHCRLKHGGTPKALKCPQCPKKFWTKRSMQLHHKLHDRQTSKVKFPKAFTCNMCDKKYSREDNLKKHKKQKHKVHTVGLVCHDSVQVPECYNETIIVDYDEVMCDERNTVGIGGNL